jgi:hypothetical protein
MFSAVVFGFLALSAAEAKKMKFETTTHAGMCDASAGVCLSADTFVAADDEQSLLSLYQLAATAPVKSFPLNGFLNGGSKKGEADIEGAARVGNRIYWITSHGLNRKGRDQESRENFFATEIRGSGTAVELAPMGQSYRRLRDDLAADPELQKYKFAEAAQKAPKEKDAFNIEGLAAGPGGSLLIGFRNPLPKGKALVVTLLNPEELIENKPGSKARFGEVFSLDLKGQGIRDMLRHSNGSHYIISGSYKGGGSSHLHKWNIETGQLAEAIHFDSGLNPEGVMEIPGNPNEILVLSDDGTRVSKANGGVECKQLPPSQRTFRVFKAPAP